jgi:hypothetical protein
VEFLLFFIAHLRFLSRFAADQGFTEGAGRQARQLTEGLSEVA